MKIKCFNSIEDVVKLYPNYEPTSFNNPKIKTFNQVKYYKLGAQIIHHENVSWKIGHFFKTIGLALLLPALCSSTYRRLICYSWKEFKNNEEITSIYVKQLNLKKEKSSSFKDLPKAKFVEDPLLKTEEAKGDELPAQTEESHPLDPNIEDLKEEGFYIFSHPEFPEHINFNKPDSLSKTSGFPNVGNSCYMNSMLQCLKRFKYLEKLLSLSDNPLFKSKDEKKNELRIKIRFKISEILEASFNNTLVTREMMKELQQLFHEVDSSIIPGEMEDPFRILNVFRDIFGFATAFQTSDNFYEEDYEPYFESFLPVYITEKTNWEENLKNFKKPITLFPYMFAIKFQSKEMWVDPQSAHAPITVPEELNLPDGISNKTVSYKVAALLAHPPYHYVSYVQDGDKWVCFNDSTVTTLDALPEKAKEQATYLIYERMGELETWGSTAE